MKSIVGTWIIALVTVMVVSCVLSPSAGAQIRSRDSATAARATAKTATPSRSRLTSLPVAKKESKITMDFRDAPIDQILNFFSITSGLTVIKDPTLTGTATLISPKPITMTDAFTILEALLDSRGFRLEKTTTMLRVLSKGGSGGGGRGGFGGPGGPGGFGGAGGPGGMGGRGQEQTQVFKLQYASARSVATIVNDLYRTTGTGGGNRGGFPRGGFGGPGGFPGMPGGNQQDNTNQAQQQTPASRASSDDYSNSVIVTGPAAQLTQIGEMIQQIDQPVGSTQVTQVFTIQYLAAADVASVISSVLLASNRGGASAGPAGSIPFEQRAWMSSRMGSSAATSGQVVAHAETNTLVVTASEQSLDLVEQVIKELDKPQATQGTTVVRSLGSASASEVANLLSSIYGRRSGTTGNTGIYGNNTFGNRTGSTQQRQRLNSNRQGNTRSGSSFGGGGGQRGGNFTFSE